jgi:hypothetical protein
MKIDWRKVSHLGAAIVGIVVPGVADVEDLAWKLGTLKGADKQDAVVKIVRNTLTAANSVTERELATDADVERATRGVIDAVVALQTIIAKKAAAPAS